MSGYYPTQPTMTQPVVYTSSHHDGHHSHHSYQPAQYPSPVQYVQSSLPQVYTAPQVVPSVAPQVILQPAYANGYYSNYQLSFGERLRRFFGLAPRGPFKYRHNKGTWGFMGYSKRPRYTDAYTGAEVDRKGRPVIRI